MLFGFGGLLASGILSGLTLKGAALGLALLFIVRPLLGALSQIGSTLPWSGRWAVAFLGIRGMGSLYYLAYGRTHGSFAEMDQLFAIVSFTILVSIILHGTTATAIMRQVEAERAHVLPGEDDHVGNETMFPDESKPAKA
jgi:NhaP-type Na+/H+ or K+/H+ antiporter